MNVKDLVRIEQLNWQEYAARMREQQPVVFLPVGALEQHGPHLPMNCDEVIPREISEAVALAVDGLVAPSLAYGYKSQPRTGGGNHFPGTTSLSAEAMIAAVRDVICEFARHGARRMVLMDGHSENTMFIIEGVDLALKELFRDGIADMKILRIGYYEFTSAETEKLVWPNGFPSWPLEHAGMMETSVMLYRYPELVDMSRLPTDVPARFPPYDVYPVSFDNLPTLPRSGALNSAKGATKEKGKLMFDEYVDRISDAVTREFCLAR
jgi:creatinine amidohydrolase